MVGQTGNTSPIGSGSLTDRDGWLIPTKLLTTHKPLPVYQPPICIYEFSTHIVSLGYKGEIQHQLVGVHLPDDLLTGLQIPR
jgi:hypothetical protein